jgi:hypothetical protein
MPAPVEPPPAPPVPLPMPPPPPLPPIPGPTRKEIETLINAALEPAPTGYVDVDHDGPIDDDKQRRVCVLVKWKGLPYSESTWEWADDIKDDAALGRFRMHNRVPNVAEALARARYESAPALDERPPGSTFKKYEKSPPFKESRTVRDYQLEGVNWLIFNWFHRRNCILVSSPASPRARPPARPHQRPLTHAALSLPRSRLPASLARVYVQADEMGLGKTIQTIALMQHLHLHENVHGPFLVIAPLSTLGHWKREFDEWTDIHCVYYHDPHQGEASRALIRKHEWLYPGRQGEKLARAGIFKFNVVLTSYHVLLMDWEYFKNIHFRYVVVDEAHALKNRDSQLQLALQEMRHDALLLLTGTPLQNDTFELWALLKLVKPDKFGSSERPHCARALARARAKPNRLRFARPARPSRPHSGRVRRLVRRPAHERAGERAAEGAAAHHAAPRQGGRGEEHPAQGGDHHQRRAHAAAEAVLPRHL